MHVCGYQPPRCQGYNLGHSKEDGSCASIKCSCKSCGCWSVLMLVMCCKSLNAILSLCFLVDNRAWHTHQNVKRNSAKRSDGMSGKIIKPIVKVQALWEKEGSCRHMHGGTLSNPFTQQKPCDRKHHMARHSHPNSDQIGPLQRHISGVEVCSRFFVVK